MNETKKPRTRAPKGIAATTETTVTRTKTWSFTPSDLRYQLRLPPDAHLTVVGSDGSKADIVPGMVVEATFTETK